MKIRYVLACLLCFGLGAAWKHHEEKEPASRLRPLLNFLTPVEFNEQVAKLNDIRKVSPDDEDAEQAAMIAHLAEEGFRLGYTEGLRQGMTHCDPEESEEGDDD